MKVIAYIIFVGTVASSCGNENNSAEELQSQKAPAVSKEFLVDMSLAPAPEGRCPNGGVIQHYYYDLNANGQMDSGENSSLLPAVDCYENVLPKSNPCMTNVVKCNKPELGSPKKIDSCETANQVQLASIEQTLYLNKIDASSQGATPGAVSCKRFISEPTDFAFGFHFQEGYKKPLDVGDFSIISMIKSVDEILIDGSPNLHLRRLTNIAAVKNSPRVKSNLLLDNIDLEAISLPEFLPTAGTEQIQIHQTNIVDLRSLALWSYQSKSPITEIWDSTITSSSGPHR
jgi:hypothetical protein